ncbi:tyrosine-protein kinase RYK-like [Tubulanus polymorphus]|uniref:tyrosine-protein kinase RYK-like n=1 Tax=Tubulanus polymorphus TaxID=672921 RepID=UPI003DA3FA60
MNMRQQQQQQRSPPGPPLTSPSHLPRSAVLRYLLLIIVFLPGVAIGIGSGANLDFFMNEAETWRLLGITAELYYVRNGVVNDYALRFILPIPADKQDIYFTWRNLGGKQMFYRMEFDVSDTRAMDFPTANITAEGVVPKRQSVFKISFPCTGKMSAEVDINIMLSITVLSATNIIKLHIQRKKMCLKTDEETFYGRNKGYQGKIYKFINDSLVETDVSAVENLEPNLMNYYYYIGIGSMCGFIFLLALCIIVFYYRSQKGQRPENISDCSSQATSHQPFLRSDTPNTTASTCLVSHMPQLPLPPGGTGGVHGNSMMRHGGSSTTVTVADVKPAPPIDPFVILAPYQIERSQVTLKEILQEGTFGRIYHGIVHLASEDDEDPETRDQEVFVKTVTDEARLDQIQMMQRECCMLHDLSHSNINPIVYVCFELEKRPLMLYPYATEGNLKKFLQRCKGADVSAHALSTQQLVFMGVQIIKGLQYLHRKRIIHKDVACRNCVIDQDLMVKLTDTALSRDLFPNDYHCLGDNENRPVKWLAIESLLERKFFYASDVWSFGVVLWELMTLGLQPYMDIDPFEIASYLREGYRQPQPSNCPDELFTVMAWCWALSPDDRPKLSQLLACLQDFYTALGRYI